MPAAVPIPELLMPPAHSPYTLLGQMFETNPLEGHMIDPATPLDPDIDHSSREPARAVGSVVAVATALVGVLVAFGVGINDTQARAVVALVIALGAAAPFIAGMLIRNRVYSPATVAKMLRLKDGRP